MKKTFLLFLLLLTQYIFAQFTEGNVKNIVGTGDKIAYVVVDFKDGTDVVYCPEIVDTFFS